MREALSKPGGAERIKRNAAWFPSSKQAKAARCAGATFRQAVRGDWARAEADDKFASKMDADLAARTRNRAPSSMQKMETYDADPNEGDESEPDADTVDVDKTRAACADLASRMVMQAPAPMRRNALAKPAPEKMPAVDTTAIWDTLSPCAQQRVHEEAIARASATAAFKAEEIALVSLEATPETQGSAVRIVLACRAEILRERAANPYVVNGKHFYDQQDAKDAQIDLDFR